MVYSASWQEYRNAEEDSEEHGDVSYSILQWEAKKFRYIYDSWGGDRVTDFLDITVSYSVVACWGCILPTIATLALVVLFISMHLRMYRLVFAVGWGSGRDLFHLSFELVQVSLELRGF